MRSFIKLAFCIFFVCTSLRTSLAQESGHEASPYNFPRNAEIRDYVLVDKIEFESQGRRVFSLLYWDGRIDVKNKRDLIDYIMSLNMRGEGFESDFSKSNQFIYYEKRFNGTRPRGALVVFYVDGVEIFRLEQNDPLASIKSTRLFSDRRPALFITATNYAGIEGNMYYQETYPYEYRSGKWEPFKYTGCGEIRPSELSLVASLHSGWQLRRTGAKHDFLTGSSRGGFGHFARISFDGESWHCKKRDTSTHLDFGDGTPDLWSYAPPPF